MIAELTDDELLTFWSGFHLTTLARLNLSFIPFYEMLWRARARPMTAASFGSGSCTHEIALALTRSEAQISCFDQTDRYIPQWSKEYLSRLPNVNFELFDFSGPIGRQFDLVFSIQTLEHIEDAEGALAALSDAVAPGGWLYIDTPLFHEHPEREPELERHRERVWRNNSHYHLGFARRRQEERVASRGLTVKASGYYSYVCGDHTIMRYTQESHRGDQAQTTPTGIRALNNALWTALVASERAYQPRYEEIDDLLLENRVCFATRVLARRSG